MNLPAAIPPTQMIVAWTLLSVLCAWMVFCAFLALRPQKVGKREAVDLPTPSGAIPIIVSPAPLRRVSTPVDMSFSGMSVVSSESVSDVGSPVA
jgi:hypothetical protein